MLLLFIKNHIDLQGGLPKPALNHNQFVVFSGVVFLPLLSDVMPDTHAIPLIQDTSELEQLLNG